jgi:hypothetical protein
MREHSKTILQAIVLAFSRTRASKDNDTMGLSQYLVFINQDRGLTYVIRAELTELAMTQS